MRVEYDEDRDGKFEKSELLENDVRISSEIADGDVLIAVVYVLALVAQFVISYFQIYIMNMAGQRVMADMRREIFSHLQRLHPAYFDKNPLGRLVTRGTPWRSGTHRNSKPRNLKPLDFFPS